MAYGNPYIRQYNSLDGKGRRDPSTKASPHHFLFVASLANASFQFPAGRGNGSISQWNQQENLAPFPVVPQPQ